MQDAVTFARGELLHALKTVERVQPWQRMEDPGGRPAQLPGVFTIVASDGDAQILSADFGTQVCVRVSCEGSGVFHPNASALSAAVERFATGAAVSLSPTDGGTAVRSGRSRLVLRGTELDALPIRQPEDGDRMLIGAAELATGLSAAEDALIEDDNRSYLGGVYMHDNGAGTAFVAMDGNRIHAQAMDGNRIHAQAILPKRLVRLLLATLPEDGDVAFTLGKRAIAAEFGDIRILSQLIDGQFPAYAPQMAAPTSRTLRAKANELLADIDLAATVAPAKDRDIRLDLGPVCEVSAFRRDEFGTQAGAVALEVNYQGAPIAIGFQMRLISDALNLFGHDEIEWRFGGANQPSFVTSPARPGLETMITPYVLASEYMRIAA